MAPVHTMSCVMGEEPELREPLSFIMGGEYASPFFPEGDTISVCCIYILEKKKSRTKNNQCLAHRKWRYTRDPPRSDNHIVILSFLVTDSQEQV